MEYLTMTIREQKNIALIAHDGKKQEMLQWFMDTCYEHQVENFKQAVEHRAAIL